VPYLSASAVVIHYEEALYQVYAPYLTLSYLTSPYIRSFQISVTESGTIRDCVRRSPSSCYHQPL